MNKKVAILFFTSFIFISGSFNVYAEKNINYERIDSFDSNITVNTDSSINVVETIKYNSGGLQKHGIYRDIRLKSYDNNNLYISDVSVINENNISYNYIENFSSDKISLKIGDPDTTFSGEKLYIIKYTISRAIGYFDKYDEIYWNVTGNDWPFPIERATVKVYLPTGAASIQSASYCGPTGSKDPCLVDGGEKYSYNNVLVPGSGMTVAIGFTKGIVKEQQKTILEIILSLINYLSLLIPIVTFILMYKQWSKYGKDPKSNRTIIAEYDVPDNLTPLEVAGVLKEKVGGKDISAEIIQLAINGYIKIEKIEEKIFIINKDDYLLKRISNNSPENDSDKKLIEELFLTSSMGSTGLEIRISQLTNKFFEKINGIAHIVFEKLIKMEYLKNNPIKIKTKYILISIGLFFISIFSLPVFESYSIVPFIMILASSFIVLFFSFIMPARTEKGLLTKEYILGLKEYLQIAEKDRINFHNAPEKKPEVFEKLLPYAMVLGVEKAWAKEFQEIYTQPPRWYSDRGMSSFNSILFVDSLNHFSSYSSSAMTSSPGGSGGGGSSGGGGGGGGGGSW